MSTNKKTDTVKKRKHQKSKHFVAKRTTMRTKYTKTKNTYSTDKNKSNSGNETKQNDNKNREPNKGYRRRPKNHLKRPNVDERTKERDDCSNYPLYNSDSSSDEERLAVKRRRKEVKEHLHDTRKGAENRNRKNTKPKRANNHIINEDEAFRNKFL